MKRTVIFLALAGLLLLTGCPFSADVPLASPTDKEPEFLYGVWDKVEDMDYPGFVTVEPLQGAEVSIDVFSYNEEISDYEVSEQYTGWITTIGGTDFLNVKSEDIFYFYKMEYPDEASLLLVEVTDNIDEEFKSSKDLFKYFKKYLHLSFFYNQTEELYRMSMK